MEYINDLENKFEYKLYSNVEKIMHPTISKRNISSYKIVLDEKIVPVKVFYPERVSQLNDIIIYVHGISLYLDVVIIILIFVKIWLLKLIDW